MSSAALEGKRICIVHPHTIATDVRLDKTVLMLTNAGAKVTIACIADTNKDVGDLENIARIWRIKRGPRLSAFSEHSNWCARVFFNKIIAGPLRYLQGKLHANDPLHGMAKSLSEKQYDAVHFINYTSSREAIRLRRLSPVPIIYESYECWPKALADLQKEQRVPWNHFALWRKREISCAKVANAIITVSKPIQETYKKFSPKACHLTIYNVALAAPLQPAPIHSPLRFYLQSFLRQHYGIESALRAFARVDKDYELTIQGPSYVPGYLERLKQLVSELKLDDRVTFASPCKNEDSVAAANDHDVGFLFLPSRIDGAENYNGKWSLPNKLFVYASAGLAMMYSTYQETTRNLLNGSESALFVDGNDEAAIACSIEDLVENPDKVTCMKNASYNWAQGYTIKTEGAKLTEMYQSILSV
ncbi:MAG: hypothetical protein FWE26_03235 [Coriobacteriia bacterium]|nr:hypothetical protein [Coriobacteriia bacterium]